MSDLEDKWAAHVRAQHPDLPEASIRRIAKSAAATLVDPPTATEQPSFTLPFWARIGLALGGRTMLSRMVGSKVTTSIAALIVLFEAFCHGGVIPAQWCAMEVPVVSLLASLGLLAAKDATVGSPPSATS